MTALLHPARQPRRPTPRPGPRAVRPAASARPAVAGRRVRFIASGLLFAAVLVGNVSVHAATTQGQFELERLKGTARGQEATYQQLRLQVAQMEAPEAVVGRARGIGMVSPVKVTYLTPTATTSASELLAPSRVVDRPTEAAQSWGRVKPHLGGRP
ncbi:MAG: hypothetical protein ABIS47_12815 [Acidimicrobiales bacterium]